MQEIEERKKQLHTGQETKGLCIKLQAQITLPSEQLAAASISSSLLLLRLSIQYFQIKFESNPSSTSIFPHKPHRVAHALRPTFPPSISLGMKTSKHGERTTAILNSSTSGVVCSFQRVVGCSFRCWCLDIRSKNLPKKREMKRRQNDKFARHGSSCEVFRAT